jgi:plastocyanin
MRIVRGILLAVCLAAGARAQDAGTIALTGKVVLTGDLPPRAKKIGMNAECLALHGDEVPRVESELVNEKNRGVRNVFVWIKTGAPKGPHPLPAKPAEIRQKGCVYIPRVQGIRAGQDLLVTNDDAVQHNVHPEPVKTRSENRSQTPGQSDTFKLAAEVMVQIKCDIHPWMFAYVGVVEHPFFAVTDADGAFTLPPLPPGAYELGAWHEKYGEKTVKVEVAKDAKPVDLSFERPKEKK